MGERDSYEHGTFCWTDLTTPDAQASKDFYGGLFGWDFEDNPIPDDGVYVMARIDGRAAGAMFETTDRHPAWASYVTVDDLDGTTARAGELGANVLAEPFDVMDVGRMSTIQDPTGAVLCLWEPKTSIGAEIVNGPGRAQPEPAEHVRHRGGRALLRRAVRVALRQRRGHGDAVLGHLPRRPVERRHDAAA